MQLLKTKIQKQEKKCRVAIRIRANPNNPHNLNKIAILMVLPPDVDGARVTMSRADGVWDELKRTVSWTIMKLPPGELIDVQAQFRYAKGVPRSAATKFPVIVSCEKNHDLFSRINLSADYNDEGSCKVNLRLKRWSKVLYRKV